MILSNMTTPWVHRGCAKCVQKPAMLPESAWPSTAFQNHPHLAVLRALHPVKLPPFPFPPLFTSAIAWPHIGLCLRSCQPEGSRRRCESLFDQLRVTLVFVNRYFSLLIASRICPIHKGKGSSCCSCRCCQPAEGPLIEYVCVCLSGLSPLPLGLAGPRFDKEPIASSDAASFHMWCSGRPGREPSTSRPPPPPLEISRLTDSETQGSSGDALRLWATENDMKRRDRLLLSLEGRGIGIRCLKASLGSPVPSTLCIRSIFVAFEGPSQSGSVTYTAKPSAVL